MKTWTMVIAAALALSGGATSAQSTMHDSVKRDRGVENAALARSRIGTAFGILTARTLPAEPMVTPDWRSPTTWAAPNSGGGGG